MRRFHFPVKYQHFSTSTKKTSDRVVKEVSVEKTPVTVQLWEMRQRMRSLPHTSTTQAPQRRNPDFSRLSIEYNFTRDTALRDLYMDCKGKVLTGKLFEDLDALAGNIAFKHCHPSEASTTTPSSTSSTSSTLSLVTASVDRIKQERALSINDDLLLVGHVCWVGKSSLDVLMEVHRLGDIPPTNETNSQTPPLPILANPSSPSLLLSSLFTYVARDPTTGRAAVVNPMDQSSLTSIDKALFQSREELALKRKATTKNASMTNAPTTISSSPSSLTSSSSSPSSMSRPHFPTPEALIEKGQAMLDMPALSPPSSILMSSTAMENSVITQPQNTNTAGRVFGGYLLHKAFDLAHATCYTFAGKYPTFQEVDEVAFKRPVDIGDLIRLKSRVVYTQNDPPKVQVEVKCLIVQPEKATSLVSNSFDFVFGFDEDDVQVGGGGGAVGGGVVGGGGGDGGVSSAKWRLRDIVPSNHEEAVTMYNAYHGRNLP